MVAEMAVRGETGPGPAVSRKVDRPSARHRSTPGGSPEGGVAALRIKAAKSVENLRKWLLNLWILLEPNP